MDWLEAAPDGPVEHDFALPELGRYERGGELGWGGMGRVITAHDRRLGRDVALKEVVTHAAAGSDASRRLAREAAITAGLDHPAIVPVFDAGVGEDGQLYYTMRLIRGRTLTQAIADAPTLRDRLGLLRHFLDVCEAMAFAHSLGVIHRDLKPENVMVGEFGETQVMDWGLARDQNSTDEPTSGALSGPGRTQLGAVIGTPAYMSPEQARGETADMRSDVWSLGVVLRELLTGETPFEGMSSDDVIAAVRTAKLAPAGPGLAEAPDELVVGTVFEGLRWYETQDWTHRVGPEDRRGQARRIASLKHSFIALQWGTKHLQRVGMEPTPIERLALGDAGELHDSSARADGAGVALLGKSGALRWLDDGALELRALPDAPAARAIATAHRSERLVLAESDGVRLIERESGRELVHYEELEESVLDVAVSPDDRWVAVGTLEGAVHVWDLEAGTLLLSLTLHDRRVAGVEFEPSGAALWTASWDGSARRIDLSDIQAPAAELVARAETRWGLSLEQALAAISR